MLDETSRDPVGVLIVEDDAVTRKSLCLAVESEPSLMLLAAFDSVKPALAWLENDAPDVLMTDLGLPDGSGIEIIQEWDSIRCELISLTPNQLVSIFRILYSPP